MASFSHIANLAGGGGCTMYHRSHTLSKPSWGKVCQIRGPFFVPPHLLNLVVGHMEINCSSTELVTVDPPSGQLCGSFLQGYILRVGGYVTNPDAAIGCQFCSARTTDQWMGPNFNIYYEHHWRNFGIFWGYIVFNVS